MRKSLIPYETILAAKAGDSDAMHAILKHYAPYIATCSKRTMYDEFGNRYEVVDDEIRQRIESKLMFQIVYHFNPYKMPPNT